jgi:hypothetical protein
MDQSKGHIAFSHDGQSELFGRDGQIYIAPVSNVIMPDGYRCGRWECEAGHLNRYIQAYSYMFPIPC